jgi:type VI secretion system secreted protein Hcp
MATDYFMLLVRQDGTLYTSESTMLVNFKDPFPGRPAIENVSKSVFEISEFSFQVEQGLNVAPTSTSGKATFGQMRLVKNIDVMTPTLFQLCATGTSFKYVDFLMRKTTGATSGAANWIYLAYGLEDVIIKSVAYASDPEAPTETLSLEYRALKVGYARQKSDGTAAPFTYRSWDQVANTP